ncbi:MAG: helix-turn-helix domain-containing protein [Streptosporangiaceae bacterium]
MTDGVLTTRQVAERLHVSLNTVQRMAADGRLHPRDKWPGRTGGFLFEAAEIEQLLGEAPGPAEKRERA